MISAPDRDRQIVEWRRALEQRLVPLWRRPRQALERQPGIAYAQVSEGLEIPAGARELAPGRDFVLVTEIKIATRAGLCDAFVAYYAGGDGGHCSILRVGGTRDGEAVFVASTAKLFEGWRHDVVAAACDDVTGAVAAVDELLAFGLRAKRQGMMGPPVMAQR